jgi:hypothetical protein
MCENTFANYTDEELEAWFENDYNPDGSDDNLYKEAKEEFYKRMEKKEQ